MDARVISKLYEVDPQFRELYDQLSAVAKSATDPADVHTDGTGTKGKKGMAAGLLAGSVAEGMSAGRAIQNLRKPTAAVVHTLKPTGFKQRAKAIAESRPGKIGEAGLQVANLGVGLLAARELVKKPKPIPGAQPVAKALSLKPLNAGAPRRAPSLRTQRPTTGTSIFGKGVVRDARTTVRNIAATSGHTTNAAADVSAMTRKVKRLIPSRLTAAAMGVGATGAVGGAAYAGSKQGAKAMTSPKPAPAPKPKPVVKAFVLRGEISKTDTDKRQVFGWASVSTIDGVDVLDLQNDLMPIEEVEKSAYRYVLESRVGGDEHSRIAKADTAPKHTADLIESMVFTDEKCAAMGLGEDFPRGWWIGMQVHDEPTWQAIKTGKRTGFSVHGTGRREEVPA